MKDQFGRLGGRTNICLVCPDGYPDIRFRFPLAVGFRPAGAPLSTQPSRPPRSIEQLQSRPLQCRNRVNSVRS